MRAATGAPSAHRPPDGVVAHLLQTAALWAGDHTLPDGHQVGASPYQDDVTFVVLRVKP